MKILKIMIIATNILKRNKKTFKKEIKNIKDSEKFIHYSTGSTLSFLNQLLFFLLRIRLHTLCIFLDISYHLNILVSQQATSN